MTETSSSEGNKSMFCFPGQCICKADSQHVSGNGTYVKAGHIYSSLTGCIHFMKNEKETVVEVRHGSEQTVVPSVGSLVTAKVISINPRFCKCAILCIENTLLKEPFRGIIRREDIREKNKDSTEVYKCFRPGDLILARVMSIGDAQSYVLHTAENELGVVIAYSETGSRMVPTSWNEMMCIETFNKEPRKIAKVVPPSFTSEVN